MRSIVLAAAGTFALLLAASGPSEAAAPSWFTDYTKAMIAAKEQGKMLLIWFHEPQRSDFVDHMTSEVFGAEGVREKLAGHVLLRLPVDAETGPKDHRTRMLDHEAFAPLGQSPGIAVLDLAHPEAEYYECVVSTIPVRTKGDLSAGQLVDLLDLPQGMPEPRERLLRRRWAARQARQQLGTPLDWHDDYRHAVLEAQREGKILLILFCAKGDVSRCDSLEDEVLVNPEVYAKLKDFVRLRMPLDGPGDGGEDAKPLIEHSSLDEMLGRQGIAMIDYKNEGAEYYGTVVSCFPILKGQPYSAEKVLVMLNLPPGKLTQRTLIYAVRTHPECPASTDGQLSPILVDEAQSHSVHQASIRLQGHHNWESRFHRINGRLANGLTACEVCAESWPGEGLLEGAIECVRCWRFSSGHWSAVRARHRCYGYDMRRGANAVWYATGIFGSRR